MSLRYCASLLLGDELFDELAELADEFSELSELSDALFELVEREQPSGPSMATTRSAVDVIVNGREVEKFHRLSTGED